MVTTQISKNDSLSKASKNLMMTQPFYGLFLMMLNKRWDNRLPTLGVSKNGINYQLTINEKFWVNQKPNHQVGILQHECLHIAFFHLEKIWEYLDKDIANYAMDYEINQYIGLDLLPGREFTETDFLAKYTPIMEQLKLDFIAGTLTKEQYADECHKIPARGLYIEDRKADGWALKAGTDYYYNKLKEAKDKKEKSACKGECGGKGTCGSEGLDRLLEGMESDCGLGPVHDWSEFEGLSESERKLLHSQTDFHLREIADQIKKSRGTVPGELAGYIDALDHKDPPKFDWKGYMRRFTGGSHKTFTKKLHRKFNKRFEDNPGLKIKQRRHVLFAVDTSASVSNEELRECFHEIHHIHRNGSDVTVIQCDAAISNISPLKRGLEDQIKIYGRGGTSFQPVIDYYNENQHKYTCLVYFTDGECGAPDNVRGKILWVLSSKSSFNHDLPGLTIQLN